MTDNRILAASLMDKSSPPVLPALSSNPLLPFRMGGGAPTMQSLLGAAPVGGIAVPCSTKDLAAPLSVPTFELYQQLSQRYRQLFLHSLYGNHALRFPFAGLPLTGPLDPVLPLPAFLAATLPPSAPLSLPPHSPSKKLQPLSPLKPLDLATPADKRLRLGADDDASKQGSPFRNLVPDGNVECPVCHEHFQVIQLNQHLNEELYRLTNWKLGQCSPASSSRTPPSFLSPASDGARCRDPFAAAAHWAERQSERYCAAKGRREALLRVQTNRLRRVNANRCSCRHLKGWPRPFSTEVQSADVHRSTEITLDADPMMRSNSKCQNVNQTPTSSHDAKSSANHSLSIEKLICSRKRKLSKSHENDSSLNGSVDGAESIKSALSTSSCSPDIKNDQVCVDDEDAPIQQKAFCANCHGDLRKLGACVSNECYHILCQPCWTQHFEHHEYKCAICSTVCSHESLRQVQVC